MSDLLFNVPWYLPTILAIVGIAVFMSSNRRQLPRWRAAGVGLVLLAIAWALISYFVDTDKEKVENGTRQAVADVVDEKWDQFQGLLTPSAVFSLPSGPALASNAADVTAMARNGAQMVKLQGAHVQNLTVEQTGPLITARFDVLTLQNTAGPQTSTWQFDWERTTAGWKIREIRAISVTGVPLEALSHYLPGLQQK